MWWCVTTDAQLETQVEDWLCTSNKPISNYKGTNFLSLVCLHRWRKSSRSWLFNPRVMQLWDECRHNRGRPATWASVCACVCLCICVRVCVCASVSMCVFVHLCASVGWGWGELRQSQPNRGNIVCMTWGFDRDRDLTTSPQQLHWTIMFLIRRNLGW